MSNVRIKTIAESDWETYKSIRLTSLKDAPDSFGSTLEREAIFSEIDWRSRITSSNGTAHVLPLFAEHEGSAIGFAWGVVHAGESKCGHVCQMWVSPEHRSAGIGRELLQQIIVWAYGLRLSSLSLAVTSINEPAVRLYESEGFVQYGTPEPLREGSLLLTKLMEKKLDTKNA